MKCIGVDMDGTLMNNAHRQHYVQVPEGEKKDWKNFNHYIMDDTPHEHIVWLTKTFYAAGNQIIIFTARTRELLIPTLIQLDEVCGLQGMYAEVYIRDWDDRRDDSIVKIEMLAKARADGYDPYLILDDRDRVVAAWRSAGIPCLQVAPGNF